MLASIKEFFRVISELRYIIPMLRYKWPELDSNASLAHSFQDTVEEFSDKDFLYFEDEVWTYSKTNEAANILANKLANEGIDHGDKVVLFMENRPSFVTSLLAINKLGAIGVLINTSLTGKPLIHCINTSDSKKCIFGDELTESLEGVLSEINITKSSDLLWVEDTVPNNCPEWASSITENLDQSKSGNLEQTNQVVAGDTAFYIFTSGTTGVPKAALFTNVKVVAGSTNITMAGYRLTSEDCMYNCLPLYHSTGLILGLCATIKVGASTFIKRKFSASSFWSEAQKFNTTAFVYVGELCRYLSFQEPCAEEVNNPINEKDLKDLLGVQKFNYGEIEEENRVGVVTGLAWTEVGGEILKIESAIMPGKGKMQITGKLGDVMQESVKAAKSFIRSKSLEYGIIPPVFEKQDFHIHVPEGATPKDGPSAGIGMVTSIVSAITNNPVKKDVAMTGEVTLTGQVLPIGGLKEKLLAAHRAGIKQVLIPKDNEKDLVDMPKKIIDDIKITPVEYADEVLKIALTKELKKVEWAEVEKISKTDEKSQASIQ